MAYVSRDPFARTELHSEYVPKSALIWHDQIGSCKECGNRSKRGGLYRFHIEHDDYIAGRRNSVIKGLFCSVSCMRTYHS